MIRVRTIFDPRSVCVIDPKKNSMEKGGEISLPPRLL
jgi:hypothetical protein